MKYVITIIVGLVVLASGASTAGAASPMKSCANTYGGDVIGARNVSCVRARDLRPDLGGPDMCATAGSTGKSFASAAAATTTPTRGSP